MSNSRECSLGEGEKAYTVRYMLPQIYGATSVWVGRDVEMRNDEVWLSPEQALSLLAWLEQERGTLEALAQGQ